MTDTADIAIVGAGAAGLMAGIQAARANASLDVRVLDSQSRIGAKILISGGGRCNVTHYTVDASSYAGSSPAAIGKVLRSFDVPAVVAFFGELGVDFKREDTDKLFPVSNRARTVLDALRTALSDAGASLVHPFRVEAIEAHADGFRLDGPNGALSARTVILATGGKSVVETGSDGHGYVLARALGHSMTPTFPALVPLCLPEDHPLTGLRGVSVPARLEVRGATGKRVVAMEGPVLFTHFGLSGPCTMDVSRHWLAGRATDPATTLVASWLPDTSREELDALLQATRGPLTEALAGRLPARVLHVLFAAAGVPAEQRGDALRKEQRRELVRCLVEQPLPVTDHRGWRFAEVTAGGVPLSEVELRTMASRRTPGLYLCGEILDVDGRIGGFNFQWAWASGTLAGRGAAGGHRRGDARP